MPPLPLRPFLSGIIDYAGLFPPASRSLDAAMSTYATHQKSDQSWLLGRFILPAKQLPPFIKNLLKRDDSKDGTLAWPLSLIIHTPSPHLLAALKRYPAHTCLSVAALEFSPQPLEAIAPITTQIPPGIETFFEIPIIQKQHLLEDYLPLLRAHRAAAKVRTGGLSAAAFPTPTALANFIAACHQEKVPFKATAGLHQPFYSQQLLPNGDSVNMHGYFNIAIAAALTWQYNLTAAEIVPLLQITSLKGFRPWLEAVVPTEFWSDLCRARQQFFRVFGSCSFTEPLAGLSELSFIHQYAQTSASTPDLIGLPAQEVNNDIPA